jgi:hypothetical protein
VAKGLAMGTGRGWSSLDCLFTIKKKINMYSVKNKKISDILDMMIREKLNHMKIDNNPAFMAFNIDYLTEENILGIQGYVFAFSHYYKDPTGDMIPDPDMEVFYNPTTKEIYPMSYQDIYGSKIAMIKEKAYKVAITEEKKYKITKAPGKWKIDYILQKDLASFLKIWLRNVVLQQRL